MLWATAHDLKDEEVSNYIKRNIKLHKGRGWMMTKTMIKKNYTTFWHHSDQVAVLAGRQQCSMQAVTRQASKDNDVAGSR
jgi:hypothetical protein